MLGPIPTGGVGIEIRTANKNVYVHFHNDRRVEIDVEQNEHFSEIETTLDQFEEESGNYFEMFLA